jgi:hypothetical protein
MATQNQIAWMRNVEERRHNRAYEAETARHNIRSEVINLYDIATRAATEKYKADTSYAATKYSADTNLAGTMYSADTNLAGTKYSADTHYRATKYSADTNLLGTQYSADMHYKSTVYSADKNYMGTVYSADKNYLGTVYSANKSYGANVLANTGRIEAAQIQAEASKSNARLQANTKARGDTLNYQSDRYRNLIQQDYNRAYFATQQAQYNLSVDRFLLDSADSLVNAGATLAKSSSDSIKSAANLISALGSL